MIHPNFLRFTAICGFITVLSTLGIHLFFSDPPADFEARAKLFQDSGYLFNRWWIIVHCLLVLVAMWGFFLLQCKKSLGFAGLGLLFFGVFAVVEIARQMFVLFYLNGLRARYLAEADAAVKSLLQHDLNTFSLFSGSFFGLFILAFGLGNLCYGLSLWRENGFSKTLSWLMIFWSLGNFMALANDFIHSGTIAQFIEKYNFLYQPFMRGLLAWWVWEGAKKHKSVKK
jgi:hypothetical protein